jgi:uncharacterized spore protein YtfJ
MTSTSEIIDRINRVVSTERVFSEPVTQDGVTVITAASVRGGGGAGGGEGPLEGDELGTGEGGGFGLIARPAGAFVISEGNVRWKPAIDVTRIIIGGQLVGVAYFVAMWLVARSAARASARAARFAARSAQG